MKYIDDLVTVVVPVYNAEKYLDDCVKSILAQTYSNIEVLLIDDGSQDNSLAICENYQSKDNRVTAYHKENGGATSARQYGFHNAHGKYTVFFDSDDIVDSKYIEEQLKNIKDTGSDMSICGYYVRNGDSDNEWKLKHSESIYYHDSFLQEVILPIVCHFDTDQSFIPGYLWMRLMKTDLITDECFFSDREVCTEDALFIIEYLKKCLCISVLDRPLYYYCVNPDTLTHKHRENRITMEIQRIQCLRNALAFYGTFDETRIVLSDFKGVCGCINNAFYFNDFHAFKNELQEVLSKREVTDILSKTPIRYLTLSERIRYIGCRMKMYRILYFVETKLNN